MYSLSVRESPELAVTHTHTKMKFTITKEDQTYMDSIGKSSAKRPSVRRSSGNPKLGALRKVIGRSHHSGKSYRHD